MNHQCPKQSASEWINSVSKSDSSLILVESDEELASFFNNKIIYELAKSNNNWRFSLKGKVLTLDEVITLSNALQPFKETLHWTKAVNPNPLIFSSLLEKIFNSKWYSNFGSLHQELEEKLRINCNGADVLLVNNATIGLMLCLKYAQLNYKGENYVITSPFTFPATAHAAKFIGLRVAFSDIDPETLCLCPKATEAIIKKFGVPKAVIPVHVFGNVADLEAFEELRRIYNFCLIYDAAHVFGTLYNNKNIGCYGDFSVFSLHATKGFHTGEGGFIVCNQERTKNKLEYLRSFGIKGYDTCFDLGINAKLSEINCAIGLALWDEIKNIQEKRKKLYQKYLREISVLDGFSAVLKESNNIISNYLYATFRVTEQSPITRDELVKELSNFNIVARKYFNPLLNQVDCYAEDSSYFNTTCKNAELAANQTITLPLYPDLSEDDIKKIVSIIRFLQFKYL